MNNQQLLLRTECCLFFQENQYSMLKAQDLAVRIGRRADYLTPVLDELVQSSILRKIGQGPTAVYQYCRPDVVRIR